MATTMATTVTLKSWQMAWAEALEYQCIGARTWVYPLHDVHAATLMSEHKNRHRLVWPLCKHRIWSGVRRPLGRVSIVVGSGVDSSQHVPVAVWPPNEPGVKEVGTPTSKKLQHMRIERSGLAKWAKTLMRIKALAFVLGFIPCTLSMSQSDANEYRQRLLWPLCKTDFGLERGDH